LAALGSDEGGVGGGRRRRRGKKRDQHGGLLTHKTPVNIKTPTVSEKHQLKQKRSENFEKKRETKKNVWNIIPI
jgi:hypothetical protein